MKERRCRQKTEFLKKQEKYDRKYLNYLKKENFGELFPDFQLLLRIYKKFGESLQDFTDAIEFLEKQEKRKD